MKMVYPFLKLKGKSFFFRPLTYRTNASVFKMKKMKPPLSNGFNPNLYIHKNIHAMIEKKEHQLYVYKLEQRFLSQTNKSER